MSYASRRPKVTLDVGPLFETQWTGIPVYTRRLTQALLRCEKVDLEFMFRLTRLPEAAVLRAIKANNGDLPP